jgi:hypothetical protein
MAVGWLESSSAELQNLESEEGWVCSGEETVFKEMCGGWF